MPEVIFNGPEGRLEGRYQPAKKKGAPIAIVEAMKMEHVLRAPVAGSVSLRVALGSQVAGDQIVATIVPVEETRVLPEERP